VKMKSATSLTTLKKKERKSWISEKRR
jgi:hypothetical protein